MNETSEIDRAAVVEFHSNLFYQQTRESVAKGELTFAESAVIYRKFIESEVLQRIVDEDMQRLSAALKGQVH